MKHLFNIDVKPCPAPRMTRSDAWRSRPCVERYHAFRDAVAEQKMGRSLPIPLVLVFRIEMPASKSKKWKLAHINQPHELTPDTDNLIKAFLDAWYRGENDSHIADVRGIKRWSDRPYIEVWEGDAWQGHPMGVEWEGHDIWGTIG